MIGCSVAFHAQEVATWIHWIDHCQVDAIAGTSDLVMNFVSGGDDPVCYHFLKFGVRIRVRRSSCHRDERPRPTLREVEEVFEIPHPPRTRLGQVDLITSQSAEDEDFVLCPGNRNIEPPFASVAVERPEVH